MPLTDQQKEIAKELLPDFDVTENTEWADVKKAHSEQYVSQELHSTEISSREGKIKGSIQQKMKQEFGFKNQQLNDKTIEDVISHTSNHIKSLNEKIAELESKDKDPEDPKDPKDPVKLPDDVQSKIKELEQLKTLLEEKENALKTLNEEKEQIASESDKRLEAYKLNQSINKLYNEANWTDDSDKYVRQGIWNEEIEGKYIFKRDEKGEVYVYDTEENIIKDGSNHMKADKLFTNILEKTKRFKKNNAKQTNDKKLTEFGKKVNENTIYASHKEKVMRDVERMRSSQQ